MRSAPAPRSESLDWRGPHAAAGWAPILRVSSFYVHFFGEGRRKPPSARLPNITPANFLFLFFGMVNEGCNTVRGWKSIRPSIYLQRSREFIVSLLPPRPNDIRSRRAAHPGRRGRRDRSGHCRRPSSRPAKLSRLLRISLPLAPPVLPGRRRRSSRQSPPAANSLTCLVPLAGLEPARPHEQQILSWLQHGMRWRLSHAPTPTSREGSAAR